MQFPKMYRVKQSLVSRPLEDLEAALESGFGAVEFLAGLGGPRVAVAVGSRRIDRLPDVVAGAVRRLRGAGAEPFIVPAMGSHGGATERGQEHVLESLGVTAASVGAPVDASMDTVRLGRTPGGAEVFAARCALEADGVVLVNRVGLHTGYSGRVQSGISKMLAVGLGKAPGARALHAHGFGAGHLIEEAAALALRELPPVTAVALLEDGTGRLSEVHVMSGEAVAFSEPALLEKAASMWPRIPLAGADVLLVEEMGKDISGVGMDPHVTGRGIEAGAGPRFEARRLVVLRLTAGSRGNATGIGHADITTAALVREIDRVATRRNVLTSGALHRARVPIAADTEREAVEMVMESLAGLDPEEARVVRIRNTRRLEEFAASEALLPELRAVEGLEIVTGGEPLSFSVGGDLL